MHPGKKKVKRCTTGSECELALAQACRSAPQARRRRGVLNSKGSARMFQTRNFSRRRVLQGAGLLVGGSLLPGKAPAQSP